MNSLEQYHHWVSKFNKGTAKQEIQKLENIINRVMSKAERDSLKYDDSGPIELANEKLELILVKVELLKFYLKYPTGNPPRNLLKDYENVLQSKQREKRDRQYMKGLGELERKDQKQREQFSKFPSLIGKRIYWKSKKLGKEMFGIVVSQKKGVDWKPRYKVMLDSGQIWNVPHCLVKSIISPRGESNKVVKKFEEQKQKFKKFKIGQIVEWKSKKTSTPKGRIVEIGRTKLRVDKDGVIWTVPFSLVTKINGQKI